jgi:hypothetical protein
MITALIAEASGVYAQAPDVETKVSQNNWTEIQEAVLQVMSALN